MEEQLDVMYLSSAHPPTHTHPHTSALLTLKVPKWAWLPKWTLLSHSFPPFLLYFLFVVPFSTRLGSGGFCGLPCWVGFYNLGPTCSAFNTHCCQGLLTIHVSYMVIFFLTSARPDCCVVDDGDYYSLLLSVTMVPTNVQPSW